MDRLKLSFLFLSFSIFAMETSAQDLNYIKSIDDCYSSYDFQKKRYLSKHQKKCYVGHQAPDFEMLSMDGEILNNETLKGKITVLNFWFTACPPCIAEMPGLNEVAKSYSSEDVNFIAASTDSYETIERFIKRKGRFGFKIAPNSSDVFYDQFYIQSGFPTTIILDEEGVIQYFFTGGLADFRASRKIRKKLYSAIDKLIGK